MYAVSVESVLSGHENWVYGVHWQPAQYTGMNRDLLEIVVWIYNTFDNNLSILNDFTKFLKESCWYYLE